MDRTHFDWRLWAGLSMAIVLAGCSSMPRQPAAPSMAHGGKTAAGESPPLPKASSGRGGYYQDDGPADQTPAGLENTPDAEPRVEPYLPRANRPYEQFGKTYTPIIDQRPFKQQGIGSWYGKKFHGQKTSSGERYDMFKMTAAHPILPIPSYARVTHLATGRQVIVRINDRGPFHSDRIIDLSYTAALRLGYLGKGSGMLEVELLLPDEIERLAQARRQGTVLAAAPVTDSAAYPPLPATLFDRGAEPVPLAAPVAQPAAPAPGYYLQLGAFAQAQNAEAMRSRYAARWSDRLPPAHVVAGGAHYRLFAGPFASREKAEDAAQQLRDSGTGKPMVVQRLAAAQ